MPPFSPDPFGCVARIRDDFVFNDGSVVQLYNNKRDLTRIADLAKTLGSNGPFILEGDKDRFWSVRDYKASRLYLLNINNNKHLLLYKELFDEKEKKMLDERITPDNGLDIEANTYGNHLTFIEMKENDIYILELVNK